ncbi:MAG: YigZ family protein [Chloroflexota bacterium]|nr:MAG: YigZ family protein [Chloroflexota bacterium]
MSNTEPRWVPAGTARIEIRVVNSRFIGTAGPAASVDEAKAFIAGVRAEMPDATHHVFAYVIGHGATKIEGMSDDGEPSGTAGRPTLAVVRGSGLGDVVVVVTRYFGGTLLGTGGLVRAYSDAAKEVLAALPREEKVERRTLAVTVSYAAYEAARRLVAAHMGSIGDEEFAAEVTLLVTLPLPQVEPLTAALREVTAGQARVEDLG